MHTDRNYRIIIVMVTWRRALARVCLRVARHNRSPIFTLTQVRKYLPWICRAVHTDGKTPERTMASTLGEFGKEGIIEFVDKRGTYRLLDPEGLYNAYKGIRELSSYGEDTVARCLTVLGIPFKPQKTFPDLKDVKLLPIDFYTDVGEVECAIEKDPEQHRRPLPHFGGEAGFIVIQKHDQMKDEWCVEHHVKMIRISATRYKDIVALLMNEFNITEPPPETNEQEIFESVNSKAVSVISDEVESVISTEENCEEIGGEEIGENEGGESETESENEATAEVARKIAKKIEKRMAKASEEIMREIMSGAIRGMIKGMARGLAKK